MSNLHVWNILANKFISHLHRIYLQRLVHISNLMHNSTAVVKYSIPKACQRNARHEDKQYTHVFSLTLLSLPANKNSLNKIEIKILQMFVIFHLQIQYVKLISMLYITKKRKKRNCLRIQNHGDRLLTHDAKRSYLQDCMLSTLWVKWLNFVSLLRDYK